MSTFTELQTRLRQDVLAEDSTAFFSDADLLGFLSEASTEIASMGGFPVATSTTALASGATTASAPSDIANVEFQSVTFGSYTLDYADSRTVKLYQGIGGQTRYYNYDPRQGGSIEVAPAAHKAASLVVEYVQDLTGTTYSGSDTPWGNNLDDWHDAVLYLAGVKAFERSQEYEMAGYWQQRLEKRLQSLAIYLDNSNLLSLISRPQGGQA